MLMMSITGCINGFQIQDKNEDNTPKIGTGAVKEYAKSKLDDSRINSDISFILGKLSMYYLENKKYPESLDKLSDFSKNKISMQDPLGNDYLYKNVNNNNFELCFYLGNNLGKKYKKGRNCVNAPKPIK